MADEVKYDAGIIQQISDDIYASATATAVVYILGGGMVGAGICAPFFAHFGWIGVGVGIALGLWVGQVAGEGKARLMRLQAQLALCQVQIEVNTAKPQPAEPAPTDLPTG
jgi:hypothetical protein